MNWRLLRIQIVSVAFISLMLFGLVTPAVWAGEAITEEPQIIKPEFQGYDLQNIYIFYDPNDETLTNVAQGIYEIVSFRINSVHMIPILDASDLDYWLSDNPWIAVYALQSNLDGVSFTDREMSWQQFYKTLRDHESTQHVVAMGNTLSLEPFLERAMVAAGVAIPFVMLFAIPIAYLWKRKEEE